MLIKLAKNYIVERTGILKNLFLYFINDLV